MPKPKKPKKVALLNTKEMQRLTARDWDFKPFIPISREILKDELDDVLSSLSARQRRVLQLRFGLADGKPKTLKEIARELGISQKRAQNIEQAALQQLRHPGKSKRLADYIE